MGSLRPSEEEAWRQFAREVRGKLTRGPSGQDRVRARVGRWTITLEAVSRGVSVPGVVSMVNHNETRITAPCVSRDGFRFRVVRLGVYDLWPPLRRLERLLSKLFPGEMKPVEVGYADLDWGFAISANDVSKARALFANPRIRDLLWSHIGMRLEARPRGKVYELHFEESAVLTDVERLKSLFELFAETLDQLCRIGSASEEDPGVQL